MLATLHHEYNSSLLIGLLEFSLFEVSGNIIDEIFISGCMFVVPIHVCTHRHKHTLSPSHTHTLSLTHSYTHTQTCTHIHTYTAGHVKKVKPVIKQRYVICLLQPNFKSLTSYHYHVKTGQGFAKSEIGPVSQHAWSESGPCTYQIGVKSVDCV